MLNPTVFVDIDAVTLRILEVPAASFNNGCNNAASSSGGIGINMAGGEVVGTPNQFTLLDQRGIDRIAQISQSIGGFPYGSGLPGTEPNQYLITGTVPTQAQKDADPSLEGTLFLLGAASLVSLEEGWIGLLEGLWLDVEDWVDAEDWVEP